MNENNSIIPIRQNGILPKVSNSIDITNKILAKTEEVLIPYRKKDKWGFCTPDKKIEIDCIYDNAEPFINGFARVEIDNEMVEIDININIYKAKHRFPEKQIGRASCRERV